MVHSVSGAWLVRQQTDDLGVGRCKVSFQIVYFVSGAGLVRQQSDEFRRGAVQSVFLNGSIC